MMNLGNFLLSPVAYLGLQPLPKQANTVSQKPLTPMPSALVQDVFVKQRAGNIAEGRNYFQIKEGIIQGIELRKIATLVEKIAPDNIRLEQQKPHNYEHLIARNAYLKDHLLGEIPEALFHTDRDSL